MRLDAPLRDEPATEPEGHLAIRAASGEARAVRRRREREHPAGMGVDTQAILAGLAGEIEPFPIAQIPTARLEAMALQELPRDLGPPIRQLPARLQHIGEVELDFSRVALFVRQILGHHRLRRSLLGLVPCAEEIDGKDHAREEQERGGDGEPCDGGEGKARAASRHARPLR